MIGADKDREGHYCEVKRLRRGPGSVGFRNLVVTRRLRCSGENEEREASFVLYMEFTAPSDMMEKNVGNIRAR